MTTVLNAYSVDYSFITDDIRVDISKQSDPLAVVATETDYYAVTGHVQRIWSFPGLERTNYIFNMYTVDGAGNPTGTTLAYFDVVPAGIAGVLVRDDEQITVGVTPGLVAGEREILFDGGEVSPGVFRPDYRGWNINPERLTPVGRTQIRGTEFVLNSGEYSWNTLTGRYALLQDDGAGNNDVFLAGETFNIDFDPIAGTAGGSVGNANMDFGILYKTATYSLTSNDFGLKIIAEPVGDYMRLNLPPIGTVPSGRPVLIEVGKTEHCAVEIYTTDTKAYVGSFIACCGDTIRIYKFIRVAGIAYEWRADSADGNFRTVGQIVNTDFAAALNFLRFTGASVSVQKYARLYQFVESLPFGQVVAYADWAFGNNRYKYSYSDGDGFNPQFMIPDLRGIYLRATNTDLAGEYFLQMVLAHKHISPFGESNAHQPPFIAPNKTSNGVWIGLNAAMDTDNYLWFTNDGTNNLLGNTTLPNPAGVIGSENRPNSRSTNIGVLI